jgi:hypothetical protein
LLKFIRGRPLKVLGVLLYSGERPQRRRRGAPLQESWQTVERGTQQRNRGALLHWEGHGKEIGVLCCMCIDVQQREIHMANKYGRCAVGVLMYSRRKAKAK